MADRERTEMAQNEERAPLVAYDDTGLGGLLRRADRGLLLRGAGAVVVLAIFGVGLFMAYDAGHQRRSEEALPLIAADPSPTRKQPDTPGGMQIPHQDKLVYQRVSPGGTPGVGADKVIPPPEEPMA